MIVSCLLLFVAIVVGTKLFYLYFSIFTNKGFVYFISSLLGIEEELDCKNINQLELGKVIAVGSRKQISESVFISLFCWHDIISCISNRDLFFFQNTLPLNFRLVCRSQQRRAFFNSKPVLVAQPWNGTWYTQNRHEPHIDNLYLAYFVGERDELRAAQHANFPHFLGGCWDSLWTSRNVVEYTEGWMDVCDDASIDFNQRLVVSDYYFFFVAAVVVFCCWLLFLSLLTACSVTCVTMQIDASADCSEFARLDRLDE
jgi:hypothetical protein